MSFTPNQKIFCAIIVFLGVSISCGQKQEWGEWGQWSSCSVTCGYGNMFRIAYWYDTKGHLTNKTISANSGCYIDKICPVDGNWTMWSPWGPCSEVCGKGVWKRSRSCVNPTPSNGGLPCSGADTEVEDCHVRECPEIPEDFQLSSCTEENFMCSSNLQCVMKHHRCDRKVQCHDGSDEKDCRHYRNGQNSLNSHSKMSMLFLSITLWISAIARRYS